MKHISGDMRLPGEAAKSKRGAFAATVVAAALVAASCGGSSASETNAAGTNPEAGSSEAEAGSSEAEAGSSEAEAGSSEAAAGSFPDTEVLSLNDGSNTNFDELVSGGDTPVLLWFFLPH